MRKKTFKGHCEKRVIAKCNEVCRTYDAIQYVYADVLQASDGSENHCLPYIPDYADSELAEQIIHLL